MTKIDELQALVYEGTFGSIAKGVLFALGADELDDKIGISQAIDKWAKDRKPVVDVDDQEFIDIASRILLSVKKKDNRSLQFHQDALRKYLKDRKIDPNSDKTLKVLLSYNRI